MANNVSAVAESPTVLIYQSGGNYQLSQAATKEALAGWIIQHQKKEHTPVEQGWVGPAVVGGTLVAITLLVAWIAHK